MNNSKIDLKTSVKPSEYPAIANCFVQKRLQNTFVYANVMFDRALKLFGQIKNRQR